MGIAEAQNCEVLLSTIFKKFIKFVILMTLSKIGNRVDQMGKLRAFFKASILRGVVVVLPAAVLGFFFKWLFISITDTIQPLTKYIVDEYGIPEISADIGVIVLVIMICFVIGVIVSTKVGGWLHIWFDEYFLKHVPGYKLVNEVVLQFFGDKSSSLFANGEVVKAQIFGKNVGTQVTALITCRHDDGTFTIFVPTGPNPTSGNIYHLESELVEQYPDVSMEEMMRSIISCGAGSAELFKNKPTK